ncbi:carbapenem biosynthesis protein CpmH [Pectobacterium sp. CFBP8739]|uniref:carbapenem biosynthesis protein CpmH n=1 Tax=unclassified Pectobacterium TaxID=2627739 RepID=UPI0015DFE6B3|nr:carbapenem biosynthesis protein CpmH [Pectobacterium sp. CFBP8739]MBA0168721.1 carbapenem biosynthesis protein CpmH [Pectobacterium sp. CFBP8739]
MKISVLMALGLLASSSAWAQHSEQDYLQRIQEFFDAEPPLCLGEKQWPVHSPKGDAPWNRGRLHALVDAGLAHATPEGTGKVYRLSPVGEKNWHQNGDLCYGRMQVSRIEKIDRVNQELTVVYFTYHLAPLERWAHNRSLRFAFSELDNLVGGMETTRYSATIRETLGGAAKLQDYPVPVELDY